MTEGEKRREGNISWYMLACNYYTLVYLIAGGLIVLRPELTAPMRVTLGILWIYVVPPLMCRVVLWVFGYPEGSTVTPKGRSYKLWWVLTQFQMIFNRIPILEEILRIIPTAYSLWLRLWGSKVSLLVYWSPGVLLTDRYLLRIGENVVLGTRSMIGGHLITRSDGGDYLLTVAPVTIEDASIVGIRAAVGPGCHIHANEVVPAGRILRPFTHWKSGRRTGIVDA